MSTNSNSAPTTSTATKTTGEKLESIGGYTLLGAFLGFIAALVLLMLGGMFTGGRIFSGGYSYHDNG